jgi:hypothetical protein
VLAITLHLVIWSVGSDLGRAGRAAIPGIRLKAAERKKDQSAEFMERIGKSGSADDFDNVSVLPQRDI